jgi:thiamine-phosphate pyrophosphorylase
VLGLDGFSAIVNAVRTPVLAIGGVTIDRMREIAAAGGAGIAAIGLFLDSAAEQCRAVQLESIARDSRKRFDTSGSRS